MYIMCFTEHLHRKRRKLVAFLLVGLFLSVFTAKAQSPTLVLHHADGKTTEVELNTMPHIVMTADEMQIKSSDAELVYDKGDVLKFTFKNVATGICTAQSGMPFLIDKNIITFHGVTETNTVRVFNTKGVQIPVSFKTDGFDVVLSIAQLPKGAYLVNINSRVIKLVRP